MDGFITQNIVEADISYVGYENNQGVWVIEKIVGGDSLFAKIDNNPNYKTYTTAWAARETLDYKTFGEVS